MGFGVHSDRRPANSRGSRVTLCLHKLWDTTSTQTKESKKSLRKRRTSRSNKLFCNQPILNTSISFTNFISLAKNHKIVHAVASASPCFTLSDLRISGPKDLLHKLLPVVLPQSRYDPRPLSPLGLPRLEAPCWPEPCLRLEVSALQTRWEPGLLEPASNPILPPRPLRKWHGPITTTTMKGPWWSKSTATRNMRWVSRSSHPGPGFYDAELTHIFGGIPGTYPLDFHWVS